VNKNQYQTWQKGLPNERSTIGRSKCCNSLKYGRKLN